jgi:hypothetical protein
MSAGDGLVVRLRFACLRKKRPRSLDASRLLDRHGCGGDVVRVCVARMISSVAQR